MKNFINLLIKYWWVTVMKNFINLLIKYWWVTVITTIVIVIAIDFLI